MKRIVQFFKDSVAELKKVMWPSREEVRSSAKVVIASVLVIAAILGLLDMAFAWVVSAIL